LLKENSLIYNKTLSKRCSVQIKFIMWNKLRDNSDNTWYFFVTFLNPSLFSMWHLMLKNDFLSDILCFELWVKLERRTYLYKADPVADSIKLFFSLTKNFLLFAVNIGFFIINEFFLYVTSITTKTFKKRRKRSEFKAT